MPLRTLNTKKGKIQMIHPKMESHNCLCQQNQVEKYFFGKMLLEGQILTRLKLHAYETFLKIVNANQISLVFSP